jgi:oligopeptide/dipeptide ABC transporter ATP-binding protein
MSLLELAGVNVRYDRSRPRNVVVDADLTVEPGQIVGLIGETGSGKTTLARAIVGLAPVESGRITFDGADLTGLRGRELRAFRRTGAVQYVFQDPLRALDPAHTVDRIVAEPLRLAGLGRDQIAERVEAALRDVGLDPAIGGRRPGAISGGQRQRVLLARALAPRPRLVLCDEPVSALDASSRNHVLRLLDGLRTTYGVTFLIISHDLSSLAGIADRVSVLYGGRIVEDGPIREVLHEPAHPYTALLAASAPSIRRERRLTPAALRRDADAAPWTAGGCVFADRCRFATGACRDVPAMTVTDDGRRVACHHAATWPALTIA